MTASIGLGKRLDGYAGGYHYVIALCIVLLGAPIRKCSRCLPCSRDIVESAVILLSLPITFGPVSDEPETPLTIIPCKE